MFEMAVELVPGLAAELVPQPGRFGNYLAVRERGQRVGIPRNRLLRGTGAAVSVQWTPPQH